MGKICLVEKYLSKLIAKNMNSSEGFHIDEEDSEYDLGMRPDKRNQLGITDQEFEDALNDPLWDYVAKKQEAIPGYNLDASGKREIKTGSLVRLSDKGMADSRYETSYTYKDAGIKTLFGKVIHVAENGEIRVEFPDLENNPDGPVRVCNHDWLIVEQ